MYISNISAIALKGQTFDHKLSPLTLITGRNFTGKTARIEAIRLALIGYIPELGKRNGDTFDLASGTRMSVQAKISTDWQKPGAEAVYERDFWIEKGAIKTSSNVGVDLNTPLMDAEAYFGLTESQRVDYVFQRAQLPDTFTGTGVIAQLQRLSLGEDHSEEHEKAKQDMICLCTRHLGKSDDVRASIETLHGKVLKEEEADAKRRAADSISAVRVLAELKNREPECSADRLTDLQNALSRADGLMEEAGQQLGRLYSQQEEATRTQQRREELASFIREGEPALPAPTLRQVPPAKTVNTELPVKELAEIEASEAFNTKPGPDAAPQLPGIAKDIGAASREFRSASNAVLAKEAKIKDVANHDSCPYCLSNKPGWAKTVVAKFEEELASIRSAKDEAYTALCKLEDKEAKLQASAEQEAEAMENWTELQQKAQALRNQIELAGIQNTTAIAHHDKAEQQAQHEYKMATQKRDNERQAWQTRRQNAEEELARLKEVAAPSAEDIESGEKVVALYRADQNEIRTKILAATKLQQDLVRAEQAAREHRIEDARAKVAKLLRATLLSIKADMVKAAFRSVLEFANEFISGILPFELAYDPERNEIGRYGAGHFIPHSTFSGTEKALVYVAIAAALSADAPFRLVILDELGRLTEDLRDRVTDRIAQLVGRGKIDQAIGVIPSDVEPVLSSTFGEWTRIHLS